MDKSAIIKYTDGFMTELFEFLKWLQEVMPTDQVMKIITLFDKINKQKIITRYYMITRELSEQIKTKDARIFNKELFIVPEIDISFFWKNLPSDKQKKVWYVMHRLLIYSQIIIQQSCPTQQNKTEKTHSKDENNEERDDDIDLMKGVGMNGTGASLDTLGDEIDAGAEDGNPLLKMVMDKMNPDEISKQLKNVDKNTISNMTGEVQKIIAPHINDPEVSGMLGNMLNDIGDELQHTDLSKGDLFENIMGIANKLSTKMKDDDKLGNCTPDKLLAPMQSLMRQMGLPSNINPADPSTMTALLGQLGGGKNNGQMQAMMQMAQNMSKNMEKNTKNNNKKGNGNKKGKK
jgi:hypothetical protein